MTNEKAFLTSRDFRQEAPLSFRGVETTAQEGALVLDFGHVAGEPFVVLVRVNHRFSPPRWEAWAKRPNQDCITPGNVFGHGSTFEESVRCLVERAFNRGEDELAYVTIKAAGLEQRENEELAKIRAKYARMRAESNSLLARCIDVVDKLAPLAT